MFHKKLEQELELQKRDIATSKSNISNILDALEINANIVKKLKEQYQEEMLQFRKEIIHDIAEKFFDTLDKIFRTNKEISLISALANQVNGKDMASLKSQLMQPFLESRWREEKIKKGEQIVNKGVAVLETRQKLHDEILKKEREGEKPENIEKLKIRLDTYDEILKEIRQ